MARPARQPVSPPPEFDLYGPIMIAVCRTGARLFRNHVGVADHLSPDGEQRKVRHGLPPGSSDLIGWTADGRFLSIEVKRPGWRSTPAWRASQQAAWLRVVAQSGGVAMVVTSVGEALDGLAMGSAGEF
jgi:hypothetical protein